MCDSEQGSRPRYGTQSVRNVLLVWRKHKKSFLAFRVSLSLCSQLKFLPTLGSRSARRLYIVIMSQIIKSTFSAQGRFLQIYDHNRLKTQDTKSLNWPRLQFEVSCRQFRRLFYESSLSFLYIVSLAVLVIDCERVWYFALNRPTCSCHTSGPWVMLTNNYCHLLIWALLTQFVECFLLKMCS